MENRARQLAEHHQASRVPGAAPSLLERLPALREALRQAYTGFVRASEERGVLSGVAEWMLDNFYVIQKAVRQIEESMPPGYYRRLPKLDEALSAGAAAPLGRDEGQVSLSGYPRVYAVAREIVRVAAGHIDVDRVRSFVRAYQDVRPLTMGEIWALPTMLRLSIVELLAWVVAEAAGIESPGLDDGLPSPVRLEGKTDEEITASAINSLRTIDAQDWDAFFEATSVVEEMLRRDPAHVYAEMDFESRDRYRGVVEELARAVDLSEQEVAEAALRLARRRADGNGQGNALRRWSRERAAHVGFYLVGRGRKRLEEALGFRPRFLEQVQRWVFDHPTFVYLSSIGVVTASVLAGLLAYAHGAGGGAWALTVVALLALVPASMVAVSLTNMVITRAVSPNVLPKLDFSDGIPSECRTMVVIPALLTSDDEVDFLLRQLELHYQGNADAEVRFALLSDFSDAPQKHMPDDDRLLKRARDGIRRLNDKYGKEKDSGKRREPFYLFHRERLWNASESCWMAWERKRGKLVEFNRLLRGEGETSYVVKMGDLDFLPQVEYVITLDADTVFPLDTGHRLIGTLAHPLNQAEFSGVGPNEEGHGDPGVERVVAGYTVLQPRTEVKPTAVTRTWFSRIFSGDAGLDLYTRAVSDVYQDFFGEGIYIGKGIYDVDAFERSLNGRAPDNALLSHDLFEGVHGRAALVADLVLFEDYPPTYLSYAHRKHRWVRGDWQILPWLFPRVPHAGEGTIPNTLSILDRWKILDNLRRSLRSPMLFALLVAGWLCLPGSPMIWTLIALITSGLPLVTGAITEIARHLGRRRSDRAGAPIWQTIEEETARVSALSRWLLNLVFLPYESILMGDAITTTLVRLAISHKRLLQWTTAAHTVRIFGRESKIGLLWRQMGGGPVLGLVVAVTLALLRPAVLPIAAPFLLAWLLSPWVAARISQPMEAEDVSLSDEEREQLRRLARRTWLFFERFVGPEDHWLPPDHFQEDPRGTVAHRTSPTNIGLLLISTLCAYDLGYIGTMDLSLRTGDAFNSMDELQTYRGHLLNWHDTRTLSPLAPRYVSTVDSGNLAACLAALAQGLEALPSERVLRWRRWRGLSDALGVLQDIVEVMGHKEKLGGERARLVEEIRRLRQKIRSVRENPAGWIPLLADLETEIVEGLDRRLAALLDAGAGRLSTATLRDLRLWSQRIHLHLRDLGEELERMVPWAFLISEPPRILLSAESRALTPAIAEAYRGLQQRLTREGASQRMLPLNPRLGETGEVCREARDELQQLRQRLRQALESSDEQDQPDLANRLKDALDWCDKLDEALESSGKTATDLINGLDDLRKRAEAYVEDMDFSFLYDKQRDVFYIGYQVDSEELDQHHYDLLASEARIASIVAIGKRDVPQRHWLHLGRPLSRMDGHRVLLSWGGSMFEYLMPDLLMRDYQETFLEQANRAAVRSQIAYAREKGVPWGISESGYYRFDAQRNYQYRGFGVPGLGRKRGLDQDLVITPYASLLAVGTMPKSVLENIRRLTQEGMLGHFGLYEAMDYTESRLPMGRTQAIVRSYMAHHQGMIMVALSNYLNGQTQEGAGIVDRFHDDPRIQSVEFLLQEQVPRQAPLEEIPEEAVGVEGRQRERVELEPWSVPTDAPLPQVHFLSNGCYGLLITEAGAGYSTYSPSRSDAGETVALTRWRADTTLDCWGTWIYVQDRDTGALWSAFEQPTGGTGEEQQVRFYPHQAEFRRKYGDVSIHTEITVAPEEDVEIRRVTLTNHGDQMRRLRLSSYGEVVLTSQRQDRRHPAFSKMFVEGEYVEDINALLFTRRPQSADEDSLHLAHVLVTQPDVEATGAYEGDRARFIGRGRTARCPLAFGQDRVQARFSGTTGVTLDPIMALGQEVEIEAHATAQVAYLTLVAESREDAIALGRRYESWPRINRAFDQAHAQSEVELRHLDLDVSDVRDAMQLLSVLLYPHRSLRADPGELAANRRGQSALWAYGISGDYPILLVRIADEERLPLVRELLRAHAYWRDRQLKVDLVILNERDVGYAQELNDQLNQLITRTDSDAWLNRRGGIFVLHADQMEEPTKVLFKTAARAVFDAERGSLADQLEDILTAPTRLPRFQPGGIEGEPEVTPPLHRPDDLQFDNGFGGFSADGRDYVVYLEAGSKGDRDDDWSPAPWINVIANPSFGFLVSDSGLGCSWAGNSGENRLTPWRNDPVSDMPAEVLYLRDEETAEVWSLTPLPAGEDSPYVIRHGAGYSIFEHHSHGLKQRLRLFAAWDAPVKVIHLRLENVWDRDRRVTATFFAEWVLGIHRDEAQQYVVSEYDSETKALLARNTYSPEFGERKESEAAVAFVAASQDPHGLTADRTEFLGRKGDRGHPAALDRVGLASRVEPGLDPCAAVQVHVELEPGQAKEVFFLLGQGEDREKALELVRRYRDDEEVAAAWEEVRASWDDLLGTVTVDTPDPGMDVLLNRWLLYQALSCRVWGRSALYQSSGAFGFRDQLQDVMALLHAAPGLAREHILRAARHQFEEGDVLHWWHPPSGRGVRTRISDDLLWLPYVTAEYVETTGDEGILHEEVPFRRGRPLEPDEEERYGHYEVTEQGATLYEHCLRALDKGATSGPHGLPLIGAGDWNDGLNRVGREGRGESVWLGWFLYAILTRFAEVCEQMEHGDRAEELRKQAEELQNALEKSAWDGSWYIRATYDDGAPLGSAQSKECKIASLAQSWAVLSGAGGEERVDQAMAAVAERLVEESEQHPPGLVHLFTPPFDTTPRDPGYIKGYPPGVRENGGQYTHAALWAVWAYTEMGQGDYAGQLFRLLNPVHHSDTREKAQRYRVEPYVVAADVYSADAYFGRGGWTWYTGSSGWMYRLGVEAILGLKRVGKAFRIEPCIPTDWSGYEMVYRHGETVYEIKVQNLDSVSQGVKRVTLDGEETSEGRIPLLRDGDRHEVRVRMG